MGGFSLLGFVNLYIHFSVANIFLVKKFIKKCEGRERENIEFSRVRRKPVPPTCTYNIKL